MKTEEQIRNEIKICLRLAQNFAERARKFSVEGNSRRSESCQRLADSFEEEAQHYKWILEEEE